MKALSDMSKTSRLEVVGELGRDLLRSFMQD